MGLNEIREPIQKRSIEKKEKIISAGFELICQNGYHNTNTAQIAKKAGVSTGIVYQYFKDKKDIFVCGLEKYSDSIFEPLVEILNQKFTKNEIPDLLRKIIKALKNSHKLSQIAHEEITAMAHSDKEIAHLYHEREITMTLKIVEILKENGFKDENLNEKVHIAIAMIDNLCHEAMYHKHKEINYDVMTDVVINAIVDLF